MDDAKKKIVPASVLCLAPDAAAALVGDLDEANRFVLVSGLVRLARAAALPTAKARVLGAVFGALGRVRLKLYAWALLTEDADPLGPQIRAVHPYVGPVITGIFGMPFGDAGIGVVPTMGSTPEDQQDITDLMVPGYDPAPVYAALVAEARAKGALFVEEAV